MPTTTNKGFVEPVIGASGWGVTLNTLFDSVDKAFGSTTSITGLPTGTTNLSSAQYTPPIIKLAGALTGNAIISLPSGVGGFWYVYNGCINTSTNTFTVTFASAGGGTSVVLRQPASNTSTTGYWSALISDGTNITFQSTLPGAASGADTQVQYSNSGILGSSSSLTYGALSPTFTGSIANSGTANAQLVVTGVTGTIYPYMTLGTITGGTFSSPTTVTITGQVSGTTGGAGTYALSQANTGTGATVGTATLTALKTPVVVANITGTAQSSTYAGATTNAVGFLTVPQSTTTAPTSAQDGYHIYTASDVTVTGSGFGVGDCFVIVNSSSSAISIIPGTSTTLRLAGSTASVAQNYSVTFAGANSANITGTGLPAVGTAVKFSGTLPAAFTAGTTYYVVSNTSGATITVSATSGGTAITAATSTTATMTNNRTIAAYGQAVALCVASNAFYISGQGVS